LNEGDILRRRDPQARLHRAPAGVNQRLGLPDPHPHSALTPTAIRDTIIEGALSRIRPKMMNVAVIVAGLLPIM